MSEQVSCTGDALVADCCAAELAHASLNAPADSGYNLIAMATCVKEQ